MADSQSASRFMGCLMGGALGDALGAPAEGIRDLDKITARFGEAGLKEMHPYTCPWEQVTHTGIGAITDDTTMHAATLGAMMASAYRPELLHKYAWQSYVRWAIHQEDGLRILPLVDLTADWPRELQPFWFACGAGRGTLAALATGKAGTPEEPLGYDDVIRGKRVVGPNEGCGGMMRAAALAFWPHAQDKFRLGMENGALTHGAPNAYLATGCIVQLVHGVIEGLSLRDSFNGMSLRLSAENNHDDVCAALELGWEQGRVSADFKTIDSLPAALGKSNAFLATPVLAQSMYAVSAYHHQGITFKEALTLSATHSGDSDSVAAIVGNVLGAHGAELPEDWLKQLQKRSALEALGQRTVRQLFL